MDVIQILSYIQERAKNNKIKYYYCIIIVTSNINFKLKFFCDDVNNNFILLSYFGIYIDRLLNVNTKYNIQVNAKRVVPSKQFLHFIVNLLCVWWLTWEQLRNELIIIISTNIFILKLNLNCSFLLYKLYFHKKS